MPETNAERLERIDEEKEFNMCGITGKLLSIELSNKAYSFLYTEAERAQELEGRNLASEENLSTFLKNNRRLREENGRLREAFMSLREALYAEFEGYINRSVRFDLGERIDKALEGDS